MNKRVIRAVAGIILLTVLFSRMEAVFYPADVQAAADKDYRSILAIALDFFDENACGNDVNTLGISWRGNCHTYDSQASLDKAVNFPAEYRAVVDPDGDGKIDVSGGYHDAGDHVKFNLTMAFAGSSLVLSDYLNPGVYEAAGAKEHLMAIVKRNADYLMKTTFLNAGGEVVAVCHVVGEGNADHAIWTSPESQTYERITYWLKADANNTAVCCDMSSAIAGAAWLYKDTDAAYASECVKYAKALLRFGKEHQGNELCGLNTFYDTAGFYGSENLYGVDETAMAEAWLWLLGEGQKPDYAIDGGNYIYQGVYYGDYDFYSWNKVWQGYAALMYKKTGAQEYEAALKFAYDNKSGLSETAYNTFNVTWGVSRYNCAMQMTALSLAKDDKDSSYAKASRYQMDYILGDNTYNLSFLIGYGNNPVKIHHRAANPGEGNAKYVLKGALVGGPDGNGYKDDVHAYQYTESALDYVGSFTLACSGLARLYCSADAVQTPTPSANKTPTPSDNKPTPSDNMPTPSENKPTPTESIPSPSGAAPSPAESTPTPSESKPSVSEDVIDAGSVELAVKQKLNVMSMMEEELGDDSIRLVKFKADDKKLASVSRKGIMTAKRAGTVVITGYRKEGKKYIPAATVSVNICKPVFKFADGTGKKIDLTYIGHTVDLNGFISGLPEGQEINWSIPEKSKCVSLNGAVLTAAKKGTVRVSCIIGDGKYSAKYKAVLKVKFPGLSQSINIKKGKTVTVGIKNVSKYTVVEWQADMGMEIVPVKDPRKIKVKSEKAGTYQLRALIDDQVYITNVTVK